MELFRGESWCYLINPKSLKINWMHQAREPSFKNASQPLGSWWLFESELLEKLFQFSIFICSHYTAFMICFQLILVIKMQILLTCKIYFVSIWDNLIKLASWFWSLHQLHLTFCLPVLNVLHILSRQTHFPSLALSQPMAIAKRMSMA